ncbi:STAS domain-containing protein [Litoribaculum gwangyangense]|uniref:STAS domain-containing protein n=1 Tax=Litoribaculum gwangyangense TaxID=1130722 RepID=A0ABP9C9S0_9FLAO
MDLKITNSNSFFKIKGVLDRSTLHIFNEEFRHIFERINILTISIQEVESIDEYGVAAIAKLHQEALTKNKRLSIIGFGCKDLYDHFKTETAA